MLKDPLIIVRGEELVAPDPTAREHGGEGGGEQGGGKGGGGRAGTMRATMTCSCERDGMTAAAGFSTVFQWLGR